MRKSYIGKIALFMTLIGLFTASVSFAKEGDKSVEATFTYGTEVADGLGGQIGGTIGGGYEFKQNIQGRLDISYLKSDASVFGLDLSYTRVPVDLGVRYFFPISHQLKAFGQGAIEISFDKAEIALTILNINGKASSSETHFGVALGGGAEFNVAPQIGITGNILYHVITDGYLSIGVGAAYHF
jgi:opacity protein-like surface antigen